MLPDLPIIKIVLSFLTVLVVIISFVFLYLRRYRNPYENDILSFFVTVFAMSVTLITSALGPIDIFLVSYMKKPDGQFAEWAIDPVVRKNVGDSIAICYYGMFILFVLVYVIGKILTALLVAYGLCFFSIFVLIPFSYLFYEEKEEDAFEDKNRFYGPLKTTAAFVILACTLLLIGAFVPLTIGHKKRNDTEAITIDTFIKDLESTKLEDAVSMLLSILCCFGMINLVFYGGFGMSSWPIGLIRGNKSTNTQSEDLQNQIIVTRTRINALSDKLKFNSLSPRQARLLATLEKEELDMKKEQQLVEAHRKSLYYKFNIVIRPLEITGGLMAFVLGVILWSSLISTNIYKINHSLGLKKGFVLTNLTFFNPMDFFLVNLQKVFPLDYIMVLIIAWYLIFCILSGVRNLGIRILFIESFKLKKMRTLPQGLLLTSVILMMSVLTFNILMNSLSPRYSTYGSQHYIYNGPNSTVQIKACPDPENAKNCIMTQSSKFINQFIYHAWYFGTFYYFMIWGFLISSILGLFYALLRKARTVTEGMISDDEFEE